MGWKGNVTISRQEAINILNGIMWDEVPNKWLGETLEVIHFICDHVSVEDTIHEEETD